MCIATIAKPNHVIMVNESSVFSIDFADIQEYIRSVVPEADIKGRDKQLHPTYIVGCGYLSLPLIAVFAQYSSYIMPE